MNATTRYVVRCALVGLFAAAGTLIALEPLSWSDALHGLLTGLVAAGGYAGIGAASPVEPSVGRKPKA